MSHPTRKIALMTIAFLAVALPGVSGTISSRQHVLPAVEAPVRTPLLITPRVSDRNLSGIPLAPNAGGPDLQRILLAQVNAKHHRLSRTFNPIIHKAADEYAIDPALIKAVIMAESRYNPKAVSKRGARGLMQLMPSTAQALGVSDAFDPEDNIFGGAFYLRTLLDRFNGDIRLALAAYNAGSRHVRNYGGVPPFKQTRTYIHKVLNYHQLFKEDA